MPQILAEGPGRAERRTGERESEERDRHPAGFQQLWRPAGRLGVIIPRVHILPLRNLSAGEMSIAMVTELFAAYYPPGPRIHICLELGHLLREAHRQCIEAVRGALVAPAGAGIRLDGVEVGAVKIMKIAKLRTGSRPLQSDLHSRREE